MNVISNGIQLTEAQLEKIKIATMNVFVILSFFILLTVCNEVFATTASGTGADDFSDVHDRIVAWTTGVMGKTISIGMVLIGIIMGMVRQSLVAFVIGIGAALGLNYTPTLIENVFSATLPL